MTALKNDSQEPERVLVARFCPLCTARASFVDARPLGGSGETQFVHVTCRKCSVKALALVLTHGEEEGSIGIVTDLSYEDVLRLSRRPSVCVDDVIQAHEFFGNSGWRCFLPKTPVGLKTRSVQKTGKSRRPGT